MLELKVQCLICSWISHSMFHHLVLYISTRLFMVIACPALNSIFNPSMISARITSFRELSGPSALQYVFNMIVWPFRSSNCGQFEWDTSKQLTFSSVTMVHSYVSWTSEQWLHNFHGNLISRVCLSKTFHKHELRYFMSPAIAS